MKTCRSEPNLALFGRVPPRTPGRSDAEVPSEAALGPSSLRAYSTHLLLLR